MSQSLYFYDLETSGVNPRTTRVMQFAGQRTDTNLKPIGESDNYLIKMSADVLPEPDAILITGITPQQTIQDGLTEAEFLKIFYKDIAKPDTVFVGFNNIRFDDEFIRFMNWRNFYDSYEWQWQDGNSKWDILDVSRMTRALRPEGIKWPVDGDGKPTNRLEALTKANSLVHDSAHDALHDVKATIDLARLIKTKQPKLYDYLFKMRKKNEVANLLETGRPFVYTSGRYPGENQKTTIAVKLCPAPGKQGVLVYDLRFSPKKFAAMNSSDLAKHFYPDKESELEKLPVKVLQYNRCPAVAPLGTLDDESKTRLKLNMAEIEKNLKELILHEDFADKILDAYQKMSDSQKQEVGLNMLNVDEKLYDGFIADPDKTKMRVVRASEQNELADLSLDFTDERLSLLLPLYKARNYPKSLNESEQKLWQQFIKNRLFDGKLPLTEKYFTRLEELSKTTKLSKQQSYVLEELNLYGESLLPEN